MKLNPQDLEKIADLTLEHYNRPAVRTAALADGCLAQIGVKSLHYSAVENRP